MKQTYLKYFSIISSYFTYIIDLKKGEKIVMMLFINIYLPIIALLVLFILLALLLYLNPSEEENDLNYKRVKVINSNKALDILDMQFANGQISEGEYLKRISLLK
jgi:uncharacterized membrane protein